MTEYYKLRRSLPWATTGAWIKIDGTTINVRNHRGEETWEDYTHCSPALWGSLIAYYTLDDGTLKLDEDWFDKCETEAELSEDCWICHCHEDYHGGMAGGKSCCDEQTEFCRHCKKK